ncbi:MAG: hypothetical protein M0R03_21390, partial [Novosphingobium sp.]|nr:hypothetical protein [Novosphingobium sp.]
VDDLFSKCGEIIPDIEKILTKYYDKNKNVLHDNMTVSKKRIVDDRIFELYYDDSNRNNIEKSLKKLQEIKLTPRENTIYKKLYDSIGLKILLIIDRTAKFPNFSGYPFLEDMKMLAMEHCIKYMKTFDRNISNNPFVFFSRTAFNAFVQELNKEKKIFNEKFEYVKKHVDEKLLKYDYKNFTIELPTTDEEIDEFYKDCESENE